MALLLPERGIVLSLLDLVSQRAPAQNQGEESRPLGAARNATLARNGNGPTPRRERQPLPTPRQDRGSPRRPSRRQTPSPLPLLRPPSAPPTHIPFAFGALVQTIPSTATSAAMAAAAEATQSSPPLGPMLPGPTASVSGGENYIGAIVGSIAAFLFIVMLAWCCLLRPRRRRGRRGAREVEVVYRAESRTTTRGY
ncbi:hypothetical protein MAPG_09216 [Magnaporthiopsis poae ATCC 64411]|uniref:Uncharacterized protein n=1 Tax=Magnaporthiopsis poae (strain ATCC 64411 / 73-15) TaxID=644358 RepID=A0A0C4E9D5_MAGP6|nr:hypothetical protein MAPG_09216 [Magnaporthiopsis poae ATCC 64411]